MSEVRSGGVLLAEDTVTIRDAAGRSVSFMVGRESASIMTPAGTMTVPREDAARFALALTGVLMAVEAGG